MGTLIDTYLEAISSKKPTELLNPATANNLYQTVPTDAVNYIGINRLMVKKTSNTPYVKFTAVQPVFGLMKSVVAGTKSPVSAKREVSSEKHITVKFKDSLIFSEEDLFTIAQAERMDANDAEMRAAAETIVTNVAGLKLKDLYTQEKLFWEGCWQGRMDVDQVNNGVESEYRLSTNVRTIAALTSTAVWSDHSGSSTADPVHDLHTMDKSFTGKGAGLDTVYMNKTTFFNMIECPAVRNKFAYTIIQLEKDKLYDKPFVLGGHTIQVYDEGYLNASNTFVNFIPDGYIIGFGKPSNSVNSNAVDLVSCLNIDAKKKDTYSVESVYGPYFRINTVDDPVSTQFLISDYRLPVFKNPQLIVVQQVHS